MDTATDLLGQRFPLEEARSYAYRAADILRPHATRVEVAGSIRRGWSPVRDIEIVVQPAMQGDLLGDGLIPLVHGIYREAAGFGVQEYGGGKAVRYSNVFGSGMGLDLYIVTPPASWGVIYAIRTGSAAYVRRVMGALRSRGLQSRGGRIVDMSTGEERPTPDEGDVFKLAGLPILPPRDRI